MEMKKLKNDDLKARIKMPGYTSIIYTMYPPTKLPALKVTISTLEQMYHDLDSKAVIMGCINFVVARLTGYKFFKEKIKVKNDQSLWGRLIELINVLITKPRSPK